LVLADAVKWMNFDFIFAGSPWGMPGMKDGETMKRITCICFAMTVVAATAGLAFAQGSNGSNQGAQTPAAQPSAAQAPAAQPAIQPGSAATTTSQSQAVPEPSLGSYARSVRKEKKAETAKEFDNDNLPKDDKLSVVGATPAGSPPADNAQPSSGTPGAPQTQPGQTSDQRQIVYDQWQQRITGQQQQIDLLSRELDVAQREYKLRAAEMYGDAGARLRNEGTWDKEDADYKAKIAEKQKAVDNAKQAMTDMQEEARKAGVPTSVREAPSAEESEKQ
jgi:hypothetical protein